MFAIVGCCALAGCGDGSNSTPSSIGYTKYDENSQKFLKYELFYDSQQKPFAFVVVGWGGGLAGKPLQDDIDMETSVDPSTGLPDVIVNGQGIDPVPGSVVVMVNNADGRLIRTLVPVDEFVSGVLDDRGRPSSSRVRTWLSEAQGEMPVRTLSQLREE